MKQLPKIADLYSDLEGASKRNEMLRLLNQPPKPEWLHINKYANNSKYIPIQIIESLLTSIYMKWHFEIKKRDYYS